MAKDDFKFRLDAKMTRVTERQMLGSLRAFAEHCNGRPFTTREYDRWKDRVCHSSTIYKRLGSWRLALARVGIEKSSVKSWRYSPRELMENLEFVWRELGRPPGACLIARHGLHISPSTYRKQWGSLRKACLLLASFKKGKITERQLLGTTTTPFRPSRAALPLKVRWDVLKRDDYVCVKCGGRPPDVELEVDHIVPVSCGGTNDLTNLRTLCRRCNQGKKDR